jgi:hypothetical protein
MDMEGEKKKEGERQERIIEDRICWKYYMCVYRNVIVKPYYVVEYTFSPHGNFCQKMYCVS